MRSPTLGILTVLHLKWWLAHCGDFHVDVFMRNNIQPENVISFWETSSPDYLPVLLPWTPLGDFRSVESKKSLNYTMCSTDECLLRSPSSNATPTCSEILQRFNEALQSWVVRYDVIANPRWRTAAFWKSKIRKNSTDDRPLFTKFCMSTYQ